MCNRSGQGGCGFVSQDKMLKLLMEKNEIIRLQTKIILEQEGRRLFQECVRHGARPGNVLQWLKERLDVSDPK